MSKAKTRENLRQVKQTLAEKYERLARVSKSIPKQKTLKRQAAKYRRQASDLAVR